jgi:hypothetical protein
MNSNLDERTSTAISKENGLSELEQQKDVEKEEEQ